MAAKRKTTSKKKKKTNKNNQLFRIIFNLTCLILALVVLTGSGTFGTSIKTDFIDLVGPTTFIIIMFIIIWINIEYLFIKTYNFKNNKFIGIIFFIIANLLTFTIINENYDMMTQTNFFYTGTFGTSLTKFFVSFIGIFGALIVALLFYYIAVMMFFGLDGFEILKRFFTSTPEKKALKKQAKIDKKNQPKMIKAEKEQKVTETKNNEVEVVTYNDTFVGEDLLNVVIDQPSNPAVVASAELVGENSHPQIQVSDAAETIIKQSAAVATGALVGSAITKSNYKFPGKSLISKASVPIKGDKNEVLKNSHIIEQTLASFNIKAKIQKVNIGPAVTQYELIPAPGVKVNQIGNLSDDLAMALAAKSILIQTPIPGKSAIGIEVPNHKPTLVTFGDVFEIDRKTEDLKMFLGRDILGNKVTLELNKTPHLLVAGSTGSGKSVAINSMILSLIMNKTPGELRLVLIDPKQVELAPYQDIPHLLTPVVTDPKKANATLKMIVQEMDERYKIFGEAGVRNIESYNSKHPKAKMPFIVCIIDELADLMLVASKEVEASIQRITQLARAAGIHLIIATQRPSVDVITGIIKANIPSRIAFAVSSNVDSRTILDQIGAEKLLGKGDMLLIPPGSSTPIRAQGAYVNDDEIFNVVNFLKQSQEVHYEDKFTKAELVQQSMNTAVDEEDELLGVAVDCILKRQKASVSILQRDLRIGYNRAARIIDVLEDKNIVSAANGTKPREVLVTENPFIGEKHD